MNLRETAEAILIVSGFVYFQVLIHELVHMIMWKAPRVAVCYGFINWKRLGFIINGEIYQLWRGEFWAYGINILIGIILWYILKKKKQRS